MRDFLDDVHDHEAILIDQGQDVQGDADLLILELRTPAARDVGEGASDEGDGVAHEQVGFDRV